MQLTYWAYALALLALSGCASYDGPRGSHVRFPDSQGPSDAPSTTSESRVPETGRIIGGNRVTRPDPSNQDSDEYSRRDEDNSYRNDNQRNNEDPDADPAPTRRGPPSTYNRPRPANAAPATNRAVSGALGSLVTQAQNAYAAGNYQTAISTAERGLRIDRRAPALYLVMAQSYLALNQPSQAAQFANQGLRFSQSGSAEARALEKVRNGAGG